MIGLLLVGFSRFESFRSRRCRKSTIRRSSSRRFLPGASADTMASAVTTPLERQFGQMPSLTQMTSVSSFGCSQITLQFDARSQHRRGRARRASGHQRSVGALAEYTARAADVFARAIRPTRRSSRSAISSDVLPLEKVDDFADSILAQKISQVSGVGLVTHQRRAEAGRARASRSRGARGLRSHDRRRSHGARRGEREQAERQHRRSAARLTRSRRTISSSEARRSFEPIVIAYKNGAPVRLVRRRACRSTASKTRSSQRGRTRSAPIILNVQRQPGANVIKVADRVKSILPQLTASMPQGIDVTRSQRPHRDRARVGRGRREDARHHDRPRRARHLPLLAQPPRDR